MGGLFVERCRSDAFCSDMSLKKGSMRAMPSRREVAKSMPVQDVSVTRGQENRSFLVLADRAACRVQRLANLFEKLFASVGLGYKPTQPLGEHRTDLVLLGKSAA